MRSLMMAQALCYRERGLQFPPQGQRLDFGCYPKAGSWLGPVARPCSCPTSCPILAYMRKTSVYLDDEQAERLARLSRAEGRSQAEIVRDAISCYRPRPERD